jgi:hypothetical protein
MKEKRSIIVPPQAPAGMESKSEFKELYPNPRITNGMKVEISPFETILRRAMKKTSQNLTSVKSSRACAILK